jgi:splicing factor 3B subunit 3
MATTSNMFMYSLTIQPPSNVVQAVLGQFAGTKEQLIATAAGSQLSLLRPDPSQGKVITVLSHDVFGIIRSLAAFRLAGSNKGKFCQHSCVRSLSDNGASADL